MTRGEQFRAAEWLRARAREHRAIMDQPEHTGMSEIKLRGCPLMAARLDDADAFDRVADFFDGCAGNTDSGG